MEYCMYYIFSYIVCLYVQFITDSQFVSANMLLYRPSSGETSEAAV